jgi:hypothetical protein
MTEHLSNPPTGPKRIVYQTWEGETYHLRPHTKTWAVTWTRRAAEKAVGLRPCQTCFRGRRPRHRGHLIEENRELRWIPS